MASSASVGRGGWRSTMCHLVVRRNLYEGCRSVNEVFRRLTSAAARGYSRAPYQIIFGGSFGMRSLVTLLLAGFIAAPAFADATLQEKTQLHFGGALGSVINVFGRSTTHEGTVSDVTIHGNRKSMRSGDSGEI